MSRVNVNARRKPKQRSKVKKQAVLHANKQTPIAKPHLKSNYLPDTSIQTFSPVIKATIPPLDVPTKKARVQDWKPVLQKYITHYNQAEADQYSAKLNELYVDQLHQWRVDDRLQRVKERELARGIHAEGSETKAEIIQVNELENEVIVHLKLHVRKRMNQNGGQYVEDRYDQERIWLAKDNQGWFITKIEPVLLERKPKIGGAATEFASDEEQNEEKVKHTIAVPYLNSQLIPNFKRQVQGKRYRRDLAVAYADLYWNKPNPNYEEFDSNCTNYVSQCIFAGDVPMLYTNRRDSGWWYKGRQQGKEWWSYSWAVSRSLAAFLLKSRKQGLNAIEVDSADQLELGDVIVYDWNGDTRYQHTTIVTAFDAKGQPLVNANTTASRHRYWDYQDSYAWTPNTRYRFFHLADYVQ